MWVKKSGGSKKTIMCRGAVLMLCIASLSIFLFDADTCAATAEGCNVIIFISDGCGFNHVDAASVYQYGEVGRQVYETFPVKYGMSHYSHGGAYDAEHVWQTYDAVQHGTTDSAASATAMATGKRTANGVLALSEGDEIFPNIFEVAEEQGKATGVVTTVPFTHATPAGFVVHHPDRWDFFSIAHKMLHESTLDVIMGAGHPYFNNDNKKVITSDNVAEDRFKYVGGSALWGPLSQGTLLGRDADRDGQSDAWAFIEEKSDFETLVTSENPPKRVVGVVQCFDTIQQKRSGPEHAGAFTVPLNADVPSLQTMALGALSVLSNNDDGFMLVIEGGAVDWASHSGQSGRMIEEQIGFNTAVDAVVDWVETESAWEKTLVIVTADHETGYLVGPGSDMRDTGPVWYPIKNNGAGVMPGMQWESGGHTNSLVPFYAKGYGAELFREYREGTDSVRGDYINNTALAQVIFRLLKK